MGCGSSHDSPHYDDGGRQRPQESIKERNQVKKGSNKAEPSTLGVKKGKLIGFFREMCEETYKFLKVLGEGGYGKVYLVEHRKTAEKFACKRMSKKKIKNKDNLAMEIELLRSLDHPNTVKLFEVYEDKTYIFLIMELLKGGELFDKILSKAQSDNYYTEKEVANLFKQVVSGISYCHENNIVHRDIKPENIIFVDESENSRVKIIDFGLSKIFEPNKNMSTVIGTSYYMSPELIKGDYNEKCDIWALGVLLFIFFCGRAPFAAEDDKKTMSKILAGKFEFKWEGWEKISSECKQLITDLLNVDPEKRPTATEVLKNHWFEKVESLPDIEIQEFIKVKVNFEEVRKYKDFNKLTKAVSAFIALRTSESDIKELLQIFTKIDKDGNGNISIEEFKFGMATYCESNGFKMDEAELGEFFQSVDIDNSHTISYNEFIAAIKERKRNKIKEVAYQAFRTFDTDKSGFLDFAEFENVINANSLDDKNELKTLFEQVDKNNDGKIDLEEFMENLSEY